MRGRDGSRQWGGGGRGLAGRRDHHGERWGAVVLDHGVARPDAGGGGGPGGALTRAGLTTPEGVCGAPAEVLNRAIGKERAAQLDSICPRDFPRQNQVSLL